MSTAVVHRRIPSRSVHPARSHSLRPTVRSSKSSTQGAIRPATSSAPRATASPVAADPALAGRAWRAAHPMAEPSLKSFRMYAGSNPSLSDLKSVGLDGMARANRGMHLVLAAAMAVLMVALMALLASWWLKPATADADSRYAAVETAAPVSTAQVAWKQGVIPSLFQADEAWGSTAYGQDTLAGAGAAPTALTMAYVAVTGDRDTTPVDFAAWGTDHDLTAAGVDTIAEYLDGASAAHGLSLTEFAANEHNIRRALVSHTPVLLVTQPGTFSPVASVVVLDDIDRDSRVVLHDPTSASRSSKTWKFEDLMNAGAATYEVHAA